MGILSPNSFKKDENAIHYSALHSKNLLMVFTRNPVLGKCKTRLAAAIGDKAALAIYNHLLEHTFSITKNVTAHKQVYYSDEIWENDIWDSGIFEKRLQQGNDLGDRMANAFRHGFEQGYKNIIVIGSDMYDLDTPDLQNAFSTLQNHNFVIGPAVDGGYYLLGMNSFKDSLFQNKKWGKETVLADSLKDLEGEDLHLFEARNDIDQLEDIEHIEALQPYLKNI